MTQATPICPDCGSPSQDAGIVMESPKLVRLHECKNAKCGKRFQTTEAAKTEKTP